MNQLILAIVSMACAAAAVIWGRSALYRRKVIERVRQESVDTEVDADVMELLVSDFRKDLHTTILYAVLAVSELAVAVVDDSSASVLTALILVPVGLTFVFGRNFVRQARLEHRRSQLERRAQ